MNPGPSVLSVYDPANYRVCLAGRLPENWTAETGATGVSIERLENGALLTTFTVGVPDQAGLHGLLSQIRDLGLALISLELIRA